MNVLYDEEIMSSWSINDSEVNIRCIYCKGHMVPNLYIEIKVRAFFLKNTIEA
jgi:hypothetical protein